MINFTLYLYPSASILDYFLHDIQPDPGPYHMVMESLEHRENFNFICQIHAQPVIFHRKCHEFHPIFQRDPNLGPAIWEAVFEGITEKAPAGASFPRPEYTRRYERRMTPPTTR